MFYPNSISHFQSNTTLIIANGVRNILQVYARFTREHSNYSGFYKFLINLGVLNFTSAFIQLCRAGLTSQEAWGPPYGGWPFLPLILCSPQNYYVDTGYILGQTSSS